MSWNELSHPPLTGARERADNPFESAVCCKNMEFVQSRLIMWKMECVVSVFIETDHSHPPAPQPCSHGHYVQLGDWQGAPKLLHKAVGVLLLVPYAGCVTRHNLNPPVLYTRPSTKNTLECV